MKQPYEVALDWVGVRFRHMGRSRAGVDCVGLLMKVAEELEVPHVDNPLYGKAPSKKNGAFDLQHYLVINCGQPVTREIQPNDILLIRFKPHHEPSHLAIAAPHRHGLAMIHTHAAFGAVTTHRISSKWRSKIVEVYPWPVKR